MSQEQAITLTINGNGIAVLQLNRPEKHNAFDDVLIQSFLNHLDTLQKHSDIRVVMLTAQGKSFSAGADIGWMKRMVEASESVNHEDAKQLATLMHRLHQLPQPTIAVVNGAVYGGGIGLIACCDIAIASQQAQFSFSEVKLGLIPAVISPYIVAAMGQRQARRYFLTAELFDADTACALGLVHMVTSAATLQSTAEALARNLLQNGPHALTACKELLTNLYRHPLNATLHEFTAHTIAKIRLSAEAQEGLRAFLEKRSPDWVPKHAN